MPARGYSARGLVVFSDHYILGSTHELNHYGPIFLNSIGYKMVLGKFRLDFECGCVLGYSGANCSVCKVYSIF